MSQYLTERRLCWCYGLLSVFLGLSIIFIAVPYIHWRTTLNMCPGTWLENTNCGCIFYGVAASQYFNGGHNSNCLYAAFAPVPILVYAIIMAMFHMYRVCINSVGRYEDEKSTSMQEIEGQSIVVTSRARVSQRNDSVIFCWIPSASIASIFGIYNLVHASIITDGFLKTCNQYRGFLVNKELRVIGDQASTVHFRLSCQAIFDYMDYLLKNPLGSINQGGRINTGALLQLAIITSWVSVALWIAVVVYTTRRAYKERHVLTCCGQ